MTYKTFFTGLITGTALGILAALFTWHMDSGTTPNNGLTNLWMMLNFPAFMVALMFRSPAMGIISFFLQWFFIGFVGALIVRWVLRSGKKVTPTSDKRIPPSERLR